MVLPDTITEWVGSAVCANKAKGFGMVPEFTVTTFKPLFGSIDVGEKLRRKEVIPVSFSAFNYNNKPLPVRQHILFSNLSINIFFELNQKNAQTNFNLILIWELPNSNVSTIFYFKIKMKLSVDDDSGIEILTESEYVVCVPGNDKEVKKMLIKATLAGDVDITASIEVDRSTDLVCDTDDTSTSHK